jgi:helix-turn-helix protein
MKINKKKYNVKKVEDVTVRMIIDTWLLAVDSNTMLNVNFTNNTLTITKLPPQR